MAAVTDISQYLEKDMVHMLIDLIDYDKSGTIEFKDFGKDGLGILDDCNTFWDEWVQPLKTYLCKYYITQVIHQLKVEFRSKNRGLNVEDCHYAKLVTHLEKEPISLTCNMFK